MAENMKIETIDDLMEVVGKQNEAIFGLGNLVALQDQEIKTQDTQIKFQDTQIKLLAALVDAHHEIFIANGMAKPRPKEDPLAIN